MSHSTRYLVRNTRERDIGAILGICEEAYPLSGGWSHDQIAAQIAAFQEGQFTVVERSGGKVVGMAASLVVDYSRFDLSSRWKDITEWGYFGTHDPERGRTLYGAEIMVAPAHQGKGVGSLLYQAREALARGRKLLNIRAGARICGYHRFADRMSAREYVRQVVIGEIEDPTLSFQLKRGFRVLGVTPRYFHDPESLHHAAVIEWLNPEVASPEDWEAGDPELSARKPRAA